MTVTNLKTVTVGQSDETFGIFHCFLARMRPDRDGAAAASAALNRRRRATFVPLIRKLENGGKRRKDSSMFGFC